MRDSCSTASAFDTGAISVNLYSLACPAIIVRDLKVRYYVTNAFAICDGYPSKVLIPRDSSSKKKTERFTIHIDSMEALPLPLQWWRFNAPDLFFTSISIAPLRRHIMNFFCELVAV